MESRALNQARWHLAQHDQLRTARERPPSPPASLLTRAVTVSEFIEDHPSHGRLSQQYSQNL